MHNTVLREQLMREHHIFRRVMDQMIAKLKDQGRVNLAHLNKLFIAFLSSFPPGYKLPELQDLTAKDAPTLTSIFFTFDQLLWRAEVATQRFAKRSIWHNVLKITLPNDGFYYHPDSIKDYNVKAVSHHKLLGTLNMFLG